jgi:hypothetical protein
MRKLDLTSIIAGVRRLGAVAEILEYMESAYTEIGAELIKGLIAGTVQPVILSGCVNTGSGSDYDISFGCIFLNGEVFQLSGFSGTAPGGQVPVLQLANTSTQLAYTDNTSHTTLVTRSLVWTFGTSGSGLADFTDLVTLKTAINDYLLAVSSQINNAISVKADIASPVFTGNPAAPTQGLADNSTKLATTAFVQGIKNQILNGAGAAFDTLLELANALGNDPNFATTMANALALKAPLANPAFTGVPTAPTAAPGTNTTQLATMAAVFLKADKQQPNWINLATVNGWSNIASSLRYRITDQNRLEIAGWIGTGAATSTIFANLPNNIIPGATEINVLVVNATDQDFIRLNVTGGSPSTLQLINYAAGKQYNIVVSVPLDSAS